MSIEITPSLERTEALRLHQTFARFSGIEGSLLMAIDVPNKIVFAGKGHKTVTDLASALNEQMIDVLDDDFVGVAGKKTISCHFKRGAKIKFDRILELAPAHDFVFQLPNKGEYHHLAVVQWGNRQNQEGATFTPPRPLVRLETVPDHPGMTNIVFPDAEMMIAFEFRLRRGFFDVEARNIAATVSGAIPDQRAA